MLVFFGLFVILLKVMSNCMITELKKGAKSAAAAGVAAGGRALTYTDTLETYMFFSRESFS